MSNAFEATFDYICHPLQCPRCGEFVVEPCDIDLQTKLARVKALRHLRVGDKLDLHPDPKESGGYLELRESHDAERLNVIETWSCPHCGAGFLWARVIFEYEVLQPVESIELNEETISTVDFITSEALMMIPVEQTLEVKQLPPSKLRAELLAAEAAFRGEQD